MHGDLGPIIGWAGQNAEFVLSTEAPNESSAALRMFAAVTDSLQAVGLTDRYPRHLELVAMVRNPSATTTDPGKRRLIVGRRDGGRFLTLVVERTVDPTAWLIVTGWSSTRAERNLLGPTR